MESRRLPAAGRSVSQEIISGLAREYGVPSDYFRVPAAADGGIIAVLPQAYTWGLCYSITADGIGGRFCYPDLGSALRSLALVNRLGADAAPLDEYWIKHRGLPEYGNTKRVDQ